MHIQIIYGKKVDLLFSSFIESKLSKWHSPTYVYFIVLHNTDTKLGKIYIRLKNNSVTEYIGNVHTMFIEGKYDRNYELEAITLTEKLFRDVGKTKIYLVADINDEAKNKIFSKLAEEMIDTTILPQNHEWRKRGIKKINRYKILM